MHGPIIGKNIFLLSIAYLTICCSLNARKKGIREKNIRQMKLCEKVHDM